MARKSSFSVRFRALAGGAMAFAVTCAALPASAEVVTLEELEAKAVAYRPALNAEAARIAAARATADLARTSYRPTAGLNVEASASPGGRLVPVSSTRGDEYLVQGSRALGEPGAFLPEARYGAVLSMQAPLYDFGRTRAAIVAADARVSAATAEEQVTRAGLVREVRSTYLAWIAAIIDHSNAKHSFANLRARRDLVEARIAAGTRPQSDLAPVLYDLSLAELEENAARAREQSAKLEVERVSGVDLSSSVLPDPALLEREPPRSRELGAEQPEARQLRTRLEVALASARAQESQSSAVLAATAEVGVRGQTGTVFPAYRAAVLFSLPLWDGGAGRARARNARAEAAIVEAEQREYRANVKKERARAWSDWTNAAERLKIAENLLSLSMTRSREAQDRYQLGDGKIEPVLEADAALARAEREVLSAKLARTDAVFRLSALSAR